MSTGEYVDHIHASFPKAHFNGRRGFVFSKSALLDGLEMVQMGTVHAEHLVEILEASDVGKDWIEKEMIQGLRKMQAIVNMLITGMDGIIFKNTGE